MSEASYERSRAKRQERRYLEMRIMYQKACEALIDIIATQDREQGKFTNAPSILAKRCLSELQEDVNGTSADMS